MKNFSQYEFILGSIIQDALRKHRQNCQSCKPSIGKPTKMGRSISYKQDGKIVVVYIYVRKKYVNCVKQLSQKIIDDLWFVVLEPLSFEVIVKERTDQNKAKHKRKAKE